MTNIYERLKDHWRAVRRAGFKDEQILGVFLYGSQNYNCDLPNSDVDTKAIIIPSLEEAILTKQWYVKELHLPNGEHCEVMDIRHFVDNLKKQNINFIETLFTDYHLINKNYRAVWGNFFLTNREGIARYDMKRGIQSMGGQAIHSIKQDPNNGKKIGNAYRILFTLSNYIKYEHLSYKECICLDDKLADIVRKYKQSSAPIAPYQIDTLINALELYKNVSSDCLSYVDKVEINNILDDAILTAIKQLEHLVVL